MFDGPWRRGVRSPPSQVARGCGPAGKPRWSRARGDTPSHAVVDHLCGPAGPLPGKTRHLTRLWTTCAARPVHCQGRHAISRGCGPAGKPRRSTAREDTPSHAVVDHLCGPAGPLPGGDTPSHAVVDHLGGPAGPQPGETRHPTRLWTTWEASLVCSQGRRLGTSGFAPSAGDSAGPSLLRPLRAGAVPRDGRPPALRARRASSAPSAERGTRPATRAPRPPLAALREGRPCWFRPRGERVLRTPVEVDVGPRVGHSRPQRPSRTRRSTALGACSAEVRFGRLPRP